MVRLAQEGGRIVLTLDRFIMRHWIVTTGELGALLIESESLEDQLLQIVETYHPNNQEGFSCCIECNISLTDVTREQVQDRVTPSVFQIQEEFMECDCCLKLYWIGTHWHNMPKYLSTNGEIQW